MRTKALRLAVASMAIGALTVMTAGTALAAPGGEKGPGVPAANKGLGTALFNVIAHAADKGANVEWGTHNAVEHVVASNPAMKPCEPPFSTIFGNPFCS